MPRNQRKKNAKAFSNLVTFSSTPAVAVVSGLISVSLGSGQPEQFLQIDYLHTQNGINVFVRVEQSIRTEK